MKTILIKNGLVVTMDPQRRVLSGDVYIEDGIIKEFPSSRKKADSVIDATNQLVLPGFIQTHIHLNQTLFRGLSEDLRVEDWLRLRIWPLEQAHDVDSVYDATRLGIAEMIRSGTTCVLSNETIYHTESVFEAMIEMGYRGFTGKIMMDRWEPGTEMLGETTEQSIKESQRLFNKFHGAGNGRIGYSFCPRGTRNITVSLWGEVLKISQENGIPIHSHAADGPTQTARLKKRGLSEIRFLESVGATIPNIVLAHCICIDEHERHILACNDMKVTHCPSANLKASLGIAKIPEMLNEGINVSLGADGAPANNNLDIFMEMRLAGLIHKPRCGPEAIPARKIVEMATLNGARALGLESEVGSIESGKRADIITIDRTGIHNQPYVASDVYTQLVYQHKANDVQTVIIDGDILLKNGRFTQLDVPEINRHATASVQRVMQRAGLVP